ncbi:MAG: helix-turn-helix transcriptional regulator [Anaerovibrio sp.]|nr:helix-turn-helix transcriptional regulator [Anaerovibrio sp.]
MSTNFRIKELRKHLNLNQAEFGTKIGLKNGAISWMEKEGNTITKQNIKIICDTFGVDEKWLLTGEGEMFHKVNETDLLERLQRELKLDAQETEVIRTFIKLSPEQRKTAINFIREFSKAFSGIAEAHQEESEKK